MPENLLLSPRESPGDLRALSNSIKQSCWLRNNEFFTFLDFSCQKRVKNFPGKKIYIFLDKLIFSSSIIIKFYPPIIYFSILATEMDEIIASLKNASLEKSTEKALPQLKKLTATTEPTACDKLDIKAELLQLLDLNDPELNIHVAKTIAEIAKNEDQRDKYTDQLVIQKLMAFFKDDPEAIEHNIQACRALGNICYSNDDARNLIKDENGDEVIYSLLQYKNTGSGDTKLQFIKVRCGVISNYLLGNEDIADRAVDLKLIDKIQENLAECVTDVEKHEDLLLNVLPPLTILTEQVADLIFEPSLNKLLAKILAACTHPDVAESCLALLCYQAQNDEVKLLLAEEGFCETIYKLLETYKTFANTDEAKVLMKMACDLIVLILTGGEL